MLEFMLQDSKRHFHVAQFQFNYAVEHCSVPSEAVVVTQKLNHCDCSPIWRR